MRWAGAPGPHVGVPASAGPLPSDRRCCRPGERLSLTGLRYVCILKEWPDHEAVRRSSNEAARPAHRPGLALHAAVGVKNLGFSGSTHILDLLTLDLPTTD